ncbi:MAG: S8 family serine peptidase [Mangrovibacterium sp.]
MRKVIYTLIAVFSFGLSAFSQDVALGSFYVKFKKAYETRSSVQESQTTSPSSRRVHSEKLFGMQTKSSALASYKMSDFAYSLKIGAKLKNAYRIDFEGVEDEEANDRLFAQLKALNNVVSVEKVYAMQTLGFEGKPNDPLMDISSMETDWHLRQIGFYEVYGKYQGNPDIKVSVVDNAVWGEHPDLQIAPENQYYALVDAVGNSSPPYNIDPIDPCESAMICESSTWSHGTHCAGLVAAITDNGIGISSFASGVTLMGVRAGDDKGSQIPRAFEGILWSIDNGAKVISCSFGNKTESEVETEIINEALAQGIVIVAAAGNDASATPQYPAAIDGVISVGSVDSNNMRSVFSNYGGWVHVAAPGGYNYSKLTRAETILSTTFSVSQVYRIDGFSALDGLYYDGKSGTSMATPLVASVVSLMLSYNPDLTPAEIMTILQETSTPVYGWDMDPEGGVINAAAAMKKVEAITEKPAIPEHDVEGNIKVYPNPVSYLINVDVSGVLNQVRVYDMSGNMTLDISNPKDNQLYVAGLPSGTYIIQAITSKGVFSTKFIKQ